MSNDELEKRLSTLFEYVEQNKIKIRSKRTLESLSKVRIDSEGRIDLSTVDGSVRALANAVLMIRNRDDLKKVSLWDIQHQYFEILETFFGNAFKEMRKHNVTAQEAALSVSSQKSFVTAFNTEASEFRRRVEEFWETYGPAVEVHIQDITGLKTVYGGDIFPSYTHNILSKTGLYVDTTILPDPLQRIVPLVEILTPEKALYYLTKHALSALSLKELVLAEVDPPIAIIAPDYFMMDQQATQFLKNVSERDVMAHLEKAFGITFDDSQEQDTFLHKIDNLSDLENRLTLPERVLFDVEWENLPFPEQWNKHKQYMLSNIRNEDFGPLSVGEELKMWSTGRMIQTNEVVFKASRLGGLPVIDAPTSWQYLLWKYEYDSDRSRETNPDLTNTLIVNALQD